MWPCDTSTARAHVLLGRIFSFFAAQLWMNPTHFSFLLIFPQFPFALSLFLWFVCSQRNSSCLPRSIPCFHRTFSVVTLLSFFPPSIILSLVLLFLCGSPSPTSDWIPSVEPQKQPSYHGDRTLSADSLTNAHLRGFMSTDTLAQTHTHTKPPTFVLKIVQLMYVQKV